MYNCVYLVTPPPKKKNKKKKLTCHTEQRITLRISVLTAAGVNHPVTLGFWLAGGYDHVYPTHHPTITVVKLASRDQDAERIRYHVQDLLDSSSMDNVEIGKVLNVVYKVEKARF